MNTQWNCPIKGCEWWITHPYEHPDPDKQIEVLLWIIEHICKHVNDSKYRCKQKKAKEEKKP